MHSFTRFGFLLLMIGFIAPAACGKVVPVEKECPTPQSSCGDVCVDLDTSADHCGACGNVCGGGEVCELGGCVPTDYVVEAKIESAWPDTTGWLNPSGQPIEMTFAPVAVPSATYQCRTGHVSIVASLPFAPCDGAQGVAPVHRPMPNGNLEEGRYRTEMRVLVGTTVSDVVSHEYYVHHSLDRATACPAPIPDERIFAAAAQVLDVQDPFVPGIELKNPFIRVPFTRVNVTPGMLNDGQGTWANTGTDYTVELHSLRRHFTSNPDNTLVLIKRRYGSRNAERFNNNAGACRNGFRFGVNNLALHGNIEPPRANIDCHYFVLNSHGRSACVSPDPQKPGEVLVQLTSEIGYVKLQRHGSFSAKGPEATCPPKYQGACTWYLELPL